MALRKYCGVTVNKEAKTDWHSHACRSRRFDNRDSMSRLFDVDLNSVVITEDREPKCCGSRAHEQQNSVQQISHPHPEDLRNP
jgi:hypothetical protein